MRLTTRILFLAVLVALAACLFILNHSFATTIDIITGGQFQFPDGTPCSGCFLYLTLSNDASVVGSGQVVSGGSPRKYQLDANGNLPAGAMIWGNDQLTPANTYYIANVTYPGGGTSMLPQAWSIVGASPINIGTMTQTIPSPLAFPSPVLIGANNTFTGVNTFTQTIQGTITNAQTAANVNNATNATNLVGPGSVSGGYTFSSTNTFGGTNLMTGATTVSNPCAIDGVLYVSQSGCYTSFAAALTQCKAQGSCVIDARGASGVLNIGTFDPNINSTTNAAVTLLLGPYTYSVTQIVLRDNLQIYGSGPSCTASTVCTKLQQATAGTAPIALPATGPYPVIVAQGVRLSNFQLKPAAGSTSDGISLVAAPNGNCTPQPSCQATNPGGGMWYSAWDHLVINAGFGRNEIRIDGTPAGNPTSAVQFATFRDIWAFRSQNAPPVLYITSAFIGQMTWDGCEFDGSSSPVDTTANLENIHIDNTPGQGAQTYVPYSTKFQNVTSQWAFGTGGTALGVHGAAAITVDNGHFEHDATIVAALTGSWGIVVMNSDIDGASGTGGLVNIDANSSLSFHDNVEGTNPPSGGFLVSGSVPTFLQWYGNVNNVGGASFSPLPEPTLTIAQLPPVAASIGVKKMVNDSTTIASEGQTCTHTGSGPVTAIAISNGSVWKCF